MTCISPWIALGVIVIFILVALSMVVVPLNQGNNIGIIILFLSVMTIIAMPLYIGAIGLDVGTAWYDWAQKSP